MQDKSNNERVVDEIMKSVDTFAIACISVGIGEMSSSEDNQKRLKNDVMESRKTIETKLRELTGNLPEGYDGSVMTGNTVHIHFDTQDNACKWYESFTDTVDAMKSTGRN